MRPTEIWDDEVRSSCSNSNASVYTMADVATRDSLRDVDELVRRTGLRGEAKARAQVQFVDQAARRVGHGVRAIFNLAACEATWCQNSS